MKKKTIFITGGNGFMGSYLKEYYSNNYTVLAPSHSELELTNLDRVSRFFDTYNVDTVIHTALAGRDNIYGIDHAHEQQNLVMFMNIWRNRHKFNRFINAGTGNEFDTTTNIDSAPEETLFERMPLASYAYAKNIVARTCKTTENFTNLRFFGVFHHTEKPVRFFRRCYLAEKPIHIFQDHYFDYINLEDIPIVMDAVIGGVEWDDINVAYTEKFRLSELARNFLDYHDIKTQVIVDATGPNNFTGDTTKLDSLNLPLKGLQAGLALY
jgi:nucleoside-diphosphate-sugar epimerase